MPVFRWGHSWDPFRDLEREVDQLLAKVWGYEYRDEPHYVRLYINYLRQKLEKDAANPKYILTERGVGYRFVDFRRSGKEKE